MGERPGWIAGEGLHAGRAAGRPRRVRAWLGGSAIELEPARDRSVEVPGDQFWTGVDQRTAVEMNQVGRGQAFDRGAATVGDVDVENQAIGLLNVREQAHRRGKVMLSEAVRSTERKGRLRRQAHGCWSS